jgi:hypothetical protein
MEVLVSCHAGYRGEEAPERFRLGERLVTVDTILDRWLAPDHRYFKIRGDDGSMYILRHDPEKGVWELVFYQITEEMPGL